MRNNLHLFKNRLFSKSLEWMNSGMYMQLVRLISGNAFVVLLFSTFLINNTQAQTQESTIAPGKIVRSCVNGLSVLDPNRDGKASTAASGFTGSDVDDASELHFKSFQQVTIEPINDLLTTGSDKATDMVDNGFKHSVSMFLDDNNNMVFRFRVDAKSSSAQAYSVLFDLDQRYGITGLTPDVNALLGNPGFELEVQLVNTKGVRVFKNDGLLTPVQAGNYLPEIDYSQVSLALTTNSNTPDYFYDFYIPFSALQAAYPGFTVDTPFRAVAVTNFSAQSALKITNVSDVAGLNLASYSYNVLQGYNALINQQTAMPATSYRNNTQPVPLPVELTTFTAAITSSSVQLNWETAQELNNAYFEIERKTAVEKDFTVIGYQQGRGTTEQTTTYTYTDTKVEKGLNYYRLKQVDFDGTETYSKVITIRYSKEAVVAAYPNPFSESFQLNYTADDNEEVSVNIYTPTGQNIASQKHAMQPGTNQIMLRLPELAAGIYILNVENAAAIVHTQRITKI